MKQNLKNNISYSRHSAGTRYVNRESLKLNPQTVTAADSDFRKIHDTLQRIVTDINTNANEKFNQMLILSMEYLHLDSAVMGSVFGSTLEISCLTGDIARSTSPDDKLLITDTVFQQALNSNETLAIHNLSTVYPSKPAMQTDAIQCFVGRQIETTNGPYGLIGFYSSQSRKTPFALNHIEVVNFIAESMGLILGYEERIELITQHTEFYKPMLRIVPAMILICDQSGLIIANSLRLSARLGTNPDSMPGKNVRQYVHPNDHVSVNTALSQGDVDCIPITLCSKDNTRIDVELNSSIKSIGTMRGIRIVVMTDVAERNKAIREVERQNRKLNVANQSLDQFASMASHDLQEPLRKIQQFSVFLQEDLQGLMTTDIKHHLNVIIKASERMTGLVQDVLLLSRTAKVNPAVNDVNLSTLIDDVIDELEIRIEEADAKITVSALPTVRGNSGFIRQLFTNLIGNSIKYRDHSRDPVIIIGAVFEGDTLAIAIRDNGIGFDPDQTKAAFEPFSRLQTSDVYDGNGIGLSICEKVCDQHNWTLSATSTPGIGSVFTVRIPQTAQH